MFRYSIHDNYRGKMSNPSTLCLSNLLITDLSFFYVLLNSNPWNLSLVVVLWVHSPLRRWSCGYSNSDVYNRTLTSNIIIKWHSFVDFSSLHFCFWLRNPLWVSILSLYSSVISLYYAIFFCSFHVMLPQISSFSLPVSIVYSVL